MTVDEALNLRIPKIRRPGWAFSGDHVVLPLLPKGYGPWAKIVSPQSAIALGDKEFGEQSILVFELGEDDDWESFGENA